MSLFAGIDVPGHPDLENVRKLDLLALPMIGRCHRLGIAIDKPYFAALTDKFTVAMQGIEKEIASYIPPDRLNEFGDASVEIEEQEGDPVFNAGSAAQIGKLLWDMLGIGADLDLKKTRTGLISTGKRQLELVRLAHPVVPKVLKHRELKKLVTTYTAKLPKLARFHPRTACCPVCELRHDVDQWRVHGEMGTTGAETGRINHRKPNLGNIPARTEDGQDVQAGFIAPIGYRLVNRDLSQIELRDLAHLSNCQSMIDVYLEGGDLHNDTCYRTGLTPWGEKPDIGERMAAKRTNFGIQNGTTEKGLYLQLVMEFGSHGKPIPDWLTEDWCKWFIAQWLEARPEVQEYFELQWYRARRYEKVWDAFGRTRLIPQVRSYHPWIRSEGLRNAQNMPVTSTAAGHLKLAMGKADGFLRDLAEGGMWVWPLLTIHDAIMIEAEEDAAEDALELLGVAMDTCMNDEETGELRFRVAIESDGEIMEGDEVAGSRWRKAA